MFHKSDALERPAGVMNDELIPLSHLALDLDVPPEGWTVYLEGRGIAVVADDLGRLAIARSDARQLFVERRENEARKAQLRAAAELRRRSAGSAVACTAWARCAGVCDS